MISSEQRGCNDDDADEPHDGSMKSFHVLLRDGRGEIPLDIREYYEHSYKIQLKENKKASDHSSSMPRENNGIQVPPCIRAKFKQITRSENTSLKRPVFLWKRVSSFKAKIQKLRN